MIRWIRSLFASPQAAPAPKAAPTLRDNADAFISVALKQSTTANVWVILYEGRWPYMRNQHWRDYVLARLANQPSFTHCKFVGPDALDPEWVFHGRVQPHNLHKLRLEDTL